MTDPDRSPEDDELAGEVPVQPDAETENIEEEGDPIGANFA